MILFSLIALEKFAQTSRNKSVIFKKIKTLEKNPLTELEKWKEEIHYIKRQVGFCAQWILDNLCKYIILYSALSIHILKVSHDL